MDFLTELDRRRKLETGGAVLGAVGVPAERAATAKRVADALGITPEMVLADPTTEQEARAQQILGVLGTAPKTSAFMSNPVNAAVAHDQTEGLAGIEREPARPVLYFETDQGKAQARRAKDGTLWLDGAGFSGPLASFRGVKPVYGSGAKPAAGSGATIGPIQSPDASIGSIATDVMNWPERMGRRFRSGVTYQGADAFEALGVDASGLRRRAEQDRANVDLSTEVLSPRFGSDTAQGVYGGFESFITSGLPGIAAAITTRNPGAGLAVAGTQTQTDAYGKYRARGATAGQASLGAGLEGGVEIATEALPMGSLVDRFGKTGAKAFIAGLVGREMVGEQVATFAQDAVDTAIANPDKTWGEFLQERPSAAYQTAIATLVQGGIMGAANEASRRIGGNVENEAAKAIVARGVAEQLDAMIERVQANPLTERSPEQMQEFLRETMPGEVHIPAEAVAAFFQAKRFDDVGAVLSDWGIADQMDEALAAKADVVVDAATYAVKIAPLAHEAFREDIRLGSGAMSLREAAEFDENHDAGLDEAAKQVVDQALADQAAAEPASKVFQTVYEQAVGAGYTPDVARQYASLWSSRYEARAARSPDLYGNALDAFNASRVAIRQDLPADLKARIDKIDVVINALRARSKPKADESLFGPSLLTFVSKGGGVVDTGGELAAMDASAWHKGKKFRGRLIKAPKGPTDAVDYGAERVAERAFDAGYIAEPTQAALLEAMQQELAGKLVFPAGATGKVSQAQEVFGASLEQLDELLARLGLSPDTATNAEIKAAIDAYQAEEFPGDRSFEQARPDDAAVRAFGEELRAKYGMRGVELHLQRGDLKVDHIAAPKGERGQGKGSAVMQEIVDYADQHGLRTVLTPGSRDDGFGTTSRARLIKFYKRFGFVENRGRTKDFALSDGMYRNPSPRSLEQPAYHGSPHVFDRFSTDAMGTGEGAQAYGWGLYFAGRKQVAEHYREALSKETFQTADGKAWSPASLRHLNVRAEAWKNGTDLDATLERARALLEGANEQTRPLLEADIAELEALKAAGGVSEHKGRLYEVQIPEDDEYLLWDAKLSEQPEKVRAGLEKALSSPGIDWNIEGLAATIFDDGDVGLLTGEAIYRKMEDVAGIDEAASKALHDAGIAGIKYQDGGSRVSHRILRPDESVSGKWVVGIAPNGPNQFFDDEASAREHLADLQSKMTYNYVVFDDSRVLITSYEQPADGSGFTGPRGRIDLLADGSRVIQVFQSRDLSTLLHEGGHLWLEELRQDAAAGSGAAQAELQIIDAWFAKNGITDLVDQHEAWARATEAYMLEGKAPSAGLRAAFGRFKSWLISLYKTVKSLNTPIDDEVRGVLDRLIATDEEIAAARASTVAEPMFPDAKAAGMTEAEFGAYSKTVARSREATHDALLVKVMGAIKRQRTAEWKAEAEDLRPDAASTVDSTPDMRALNWLRSNKQAISRQGVIDVLGDESALAMLPKGVPPLVVEKGGVHPDSLAEAAGYRTGDEMLRGLMAVETERQAMKAQKDKRSVRAARIDAEVARLQAERHGDPFTDGSIEREALDAIHHERQGEVLAAELRALGRKTDSKPTPLQVMREWARASIAGKRLRDATRTDRYLRAERKAANAAIEAAAKGDSATAVREKQAQLLNHLLYSEARKAADLAEKAIKLMSRYAKARTIKGMDQDYLDQIHTLLEQYDFAPTTLRAADRRASFAAWVQAKRDAGEDVSVSDELLTNATRTPYVNMTIDELAGLYDAVRSIAHLGRLKQTLLDNREKRDYEAVIDEAMTQGGKLKTVRDLSVANPDPKWWAAGDAALLKVETWVDWLDDGDVNGVFNRLLIRPATDAADREGQLREEVSAKIGALREAVPAAQRKAWTNAWASPFLLEPRTGEPLKLQRGDLIAMALNTGNESNLDKLVRGYGWSAEQVQKVLNAELTAEEWTFVQGVWDTLETLWPDIAAVERKLSGVEPERVIPREVDTPHGTLAGGYYPAVYDYERSADAAKWAAKEAGDMFGGVFYTAGTPKGHTQTRTNYAAPISLSVNRVLNGHISKVIKRVAYGEFVVSARKFITDKRIRQLIQTKLGEEYYSQLMPWLTRQVVDQVSPSKELAFWEGLARKARVNFQMVAMGFRVSTGLAQIAGLSSSAAVIGPEWVAKGLAETLRLGVQGAPAFVFRRSPEMEQRGRELDRDLRDAMRDFDGQGLLDPIRRAAFMHIGFIDRYMVAMPTWLGAYQKAISEGHTEEDAIASGDKAVRTSQGSGRAKDLAAVQAPSSEFMKLFTLFYSYFNVQYQRQRDSGRALGKGDIAPALSTSFWMLIVAPMAGALLTGDWPDWEDEESVIQWLWTKPFFNLWQGIPVVRDAASFAERKVTGKYSSGYALSPINRVGESVETLLGDIAKMVKDGEPGDRWIKHAIETPGYFVGLPTGQIGNTVQYLSDLIDGDQEPENVAEFLTGMMKGPQKDQ